ncbi:MAG: 4Fe-4S binding protein [Proteobacteria bacterium]|nr:4Fe-4S binding protein [Pseudomonadota bacterium]MBU1716436.1 4Fe-4S binding protein [Pseudomonadota bacterium]
MGFVRKWVQIVFGFVMNGYWAFPFTRNIYQGPLKVICAPGLNCYSCPASTTYCAMGALQQLMAGIRFSLESGQYYLGGSILGSLGVLGGLFGRMVCGWACPFGFVQEMLNKIPSPSFSVPRVLRFCKYFVLVFMVFLLPLLVVDEFGGGSPWFCKYICPAGTLEAGLPMLILQPDLKSTLGVLFLNKFVIMIMFVGWSIVSSRPFCQTLCPLGAFYALFSKVKLIKLRFDEAKCTACKACHPVCPMGVKFNESPDDLECITCLKCMNQACKFDAIYLEIGGVSVGSRRNLAPVARENV